MLIKFIKSNTKMGCFCIAYKNNPSKEPIECKGVSHLIEHCMTELASKNEKQLIKYGLNWNASTSDTIVDFYMNGIDKNVNKIRDKFYNWITNYEISPQVFERERSIVIQEYEQLFSDQRTRHFYNFRRMYMNDCSVIGYKPDLLNLKYDDFINYKNQYFKSPDMIKCISKNPYQNKQDEQQIILDNTNYELKFDINNFPIDTSTKFQTNHVILAQMYDTSDFNIVCYLYLLGIILSNGLTSPLFNELRAKLQAVYGVTAGFKTISNNQSLFVFATTTNKNKCDQVTNKLIEIKSNLKKYITKSMFKYNLDCIKYVHQQMDILNYDYIDDLFDPKFQFIKQNIQSIQYLDFIDKCQQLMDIKFVLDIDEGNYEN